ncbi:uncharacterized protein [Antedon mediterranea]|uniref:uncharacterized protein n=1 Tax=Antedon mediterranea TaxID=105859 RepID=UPI003AF462D3
MDQALVDRYLTSQNCQWIFNPPHASHFGGVWERQIGTIRRILEAMFDQLGGHRLTHEVLVTLMAEACAIVNSRPITTQSADPIALSPSMLLTQKSMSLHPPPGNFVKEDIYGRKRWRQVQYLADQFWARWKKEYLQNLQSRQKWFHTKPDISDDDVVLLREKDDPRCNWPLGRVIKTYPSEDGKVCKADILICRDGTRRTYLRPISELVLIQKAPISTLFRLDYSD